jgi:RimJ/RimL family protein N-acetyltransferase
MRRPPALLSTPRLTLRAWRPDDAAALRGALDASDAHLRPWIPFMAAEPRTLAETRRGLEALQAAFAAGTAYRWGAWRAADEALVGEAMLLERPTPWAPQALELGYWLHAGHTGQGYAGEAAAAMVQVALQTLARGVVIRCDVENAPSNKVAARLGARPVGEEEVGPPLPGRLRVWALP